MVKGQKLVCINDVFVDSIRAIRTELPVRERTYIIRDVFPGARSL